MKSSSTSFQIYQVKDVYFFVFCDQFQHFRKTEGKQHEANEDNVAALQVGAVGGHDVDNVVMHCDIA